MKYSILKPVEFGVITTFSRYVINIIPVDIDILKNCIPFELTLWHNSIFVQNLIYFCATFFVFDNTLNIKWQIAIC